MKHIIFGFLLIGCTSSPADLAKLKKQEEKRKEYDARMKKIQQEKNEWIIKQIMIRHLNEELNNKYGK